MERPNEIGSLKRKHLSIKLEVAGREGSEWIGRYICECKSRWGRQGAPCKVKCGLKLGPKARVECIPMGSLAEPWDQCWWAFQEGSKSLIMTENVTNLQYRGALSLLLKWNFDTEMRYPGRYSKRLRFLIVHQPILKRTKVATVVLALHNVTW